MIELRQVTGGYGPVPVLKGINLTIPRGSITTLAGPNGCGKTTLLKIAARLLKPSGGQVLLDGKPVADYGRKEFARMVAVMPQARNVPAITVEGLAMHGRFPYLGLSRKPGAEDHEKVQEALEAVGVWDLRGRDLRGLSGGERQKAYIAMAVAQDTDVIFLDEPTTYLDMGKQFELLELVQKLNQSGKTIVMVLHDLAHSLRFSQRIVVMERGRIAAAGQPEEIFDAGILERVFDVRGHRDGENYYFTHW